MKFLIELTPKQQSQITHVLNSPWPSFVVARIFSSCLITFCSSLVKTSFWRWHSTPSCSCSKEPRTTPQNQFEYQSLVVKSSGKSAYSANGLLWSTNENTANSLCQWLTSAPIPGDIRSPTLSITATVSRKSWQIGLPLFCGNSSTSQRPIL